MRSSIFFSAAALPLAAAFPLAGLFSAQSERACELPAEADPDVVDKVYAVAKERLASEPVMLAAFEAAWAESHFNNLDCGASDPNAAGVFQSRSSNARDVTYATHALLDKLQAHEASLPEDRELSRRAMLQACARSTGPLGPEYDTAAHPAYSLLRDARVRARDFDILARQAASCDVAGIPTPTGEPAPPTSTAPPSAPTTTMPPSAPTTTASPTSPTTTTAPPSAPTSGPGNGGDGGDCGDDDGPGDGDGDGGDDGCGDDDGSGGGGGDDNGSGGDDGCGDDDGSGGDNGSGGSESGGDDGGNDCGDDGSGDGDGDGDGDDCGDDGSGDGDGDGDGDDCDCDDGQ